MRKRGAYTADVISGVRAEFRRHYPCATFEEKQILIAPALESDSLALTSYSERSASAELRPDTEKYRCSLFRSKWTRRDSGEMPRSTAARVTYHMSAWWLRFSKCSSPAVKFHFPPAFQW